jgi:hypothetical protein
VAHTPEFIAELSRTVSRVRLFRYLRASQQDIELALTLYEKNVLLSQAVFGFLHGLEVAVRNSIHYVLSRDLGSPNWIQDNLPLAWPKPAPSHFKLTKPMSDMLELALSKLGPSPSVGKLIAELNFGFWVDLLGARYEYLWVKSLHQAFPEAHHPRNIVHWRLDTIRHLRNRVAHHEPIITSTDQVCTGRFEEKLIHLRALAECVSWVSPHTAQWLTETTYIRQAEDLLEEVAATDITL